MQTITHIQPNLNPLFTEFEYLYAITSERHNVQNQLIPPAISNIFIPLLHLFQDYGNAEYHVKFHEYHVNKIKLEKYSKKNIIVCFSGGKDSLATALYYMQKKYDVHLYHLKGINKTYKDEYLTAKKLAEMLGLPLYTDEIQLKGEQEWTEHPLKNMILANMALQYGIRTGIGTNIAFGNFYTSTLEEDPFDVCGGDCKEMWQEYNKVIQYIIPGFEVCTPLQNFQTTIDILCKYPEYISYTQSCIGPYRYREYLHKNNQIKYNIELPEHRCGSCWKCCLEYIIFCDKGIYDYNEAYYNHCIDILQTTLYKETGIKYNKNDTFNHYIFYDRSQSKWVV